ncbi:MAG: hypothetical protein ACREKN_03965 [Longimicrobiaceae bacterium]
MNTPLPGLTDPSLTLQPPGRERPVGVFAAVGFAAAALWALLYLSAGTPYLGLFLLAAAAVFASAPVLHRRFGAEAAAHAVVATAVAAVFITVLFTGGVSEFVGLWLVVLPIAPGLLLRFWAALGWGVGILSAVILCWALELTGALTPPGLPLDAWWAWWLLPPISGVTAVAVALALSLLYARSKESALDRL